MNSKLLNWIAFRYFFSKKKTGLISFTSWVSICGIALGAFTLIVALSVLNGFEDEITRRVIDIESHLRVSGNDLKPQDLRQVTAELATAKVRAIYPFVLKKAILSSNTLDAVVRIKGIDTLTLVRRLEPNMTLIRGGANLQSATSDLPGMLIGYRLADKLGVYPGDTLLVINPLTLTSSLSLPISGRFAVTGIFRLDLFDYDENLAFIDLGQAQTLFGMGQNFSGIDIIFSHYNAVNQYQERLQKALTNEFDVSSWEDQHQSLFGAMKLEKYGSFLALSFIIIVAIFNLTSALVMLIMEKVREIGMLQVLGLNRSHIRRVFMRLGFIVGSIGMTVGVLLALAFCLSQQYYRYLPLPPVYFIPYLPVQVQLLDVLMVIIAGLVLIYAGAVYPSRRVAQLFPLEAIQYEK